MNKRCTSCTEKEYKQCVCLLREGFEWNGKLIKPNYRIATVVILEATIGLRLGDVLRLRLSDFVRDGERWRLDFLEDKKSSELLPFPIKSIILFSLMLMIKRFLKHLNCLKFQSVRCKGI